MPGTVLGTSWALTELSSQWPSELDVYYYPHSTDEASYPKAAALGGWDPGSGSLCPSTHDTALLLKSLSASEVSPLHAMSTHMAPVVKPSPVYPLWSSGALVRRDPLNPMLEVHPA